MTPQTLNTCCQCKPGLNSVIWGYSFTSSVVPAENVLLGFFPNTARRCVLWWLDKWLISYGHFPVKPCLFYGSRAFLLSTLSWIYDVREVHVPQLHFWVLIIAASSEPLGHISWEALFFLIVIGPNSNSFQLRQFGTIQQKNKNNKQRQTLKDWASCCLKIK